MLSPFTTDVFTDDEGRYLFTNLPADQYRITPQSKSPDIMKAEWFGRCVTGIQANASEQTEVADLKIGQGGILRGQLHDAATGKPPAIDYAKAKLTVLFLLLDNKTGLRSYQSCTARNLFCSSTGVFETRAPTGKFRTLVFVDLSGRRESGRHAYATSDSWDRLGPVYEGMEGQTLQTRIEVHSAQALEARHDKVQQGYQLIEAKKFDEAVLHFTAALKIDSKNIELLAGRTLAYERLGDYSAALADLEISAELEPRMSGKLAYFW